MLSKLQDFTAKTLGMERTLSNVIVNEKGEVKRKSTTNKKRLDTHEFKEQAKIINETKKDLVSEKELKKQIQELKKELQDEKAKRPDYAKLEDMNKSLLEKIKNKNLTITNFEIEISKYKKDREDLKKQIDNLTVKNKDLTNLTSTLAAESVSNFKEAEKYKEKVNTLENQNKALQEEIKQKPVQSIENELKALVSSEINLNDIKKNSLDLFTSDFKEEINLKENGVFNKTYKIELKQEFKSQEITLENIGLFKRTQMKIMNLLETIKNQALRIAGLKKENQILNSELKSERLKNQVLEIKVLNLENKNKSLSLTGEKKEDHLDKIVSNYDKMKARQLDTKEILETSKKEKDQEQEKPKENVNTKRQNYGYELR